MKCRTESFLQHMSISKVTAELSVVANKSEYLLIKQRSLSALQKFLEFHNMGLGIFSAIGEEKLMLVNFFFLNLITHFSCYVILDCTWA